MATKTAAKKATTKAKTTAAKSSTKAKASATRAKTAAKASAAKAKTATKAAAESVKAETTAQAKETEARVQNLVDRIQASVGELREALRESGGAFTDGNRELGLRVLTHAQTNAEAGFDALRKTLTAESVSDALKVQQDTVRDSIERNLDQARDIGSLINANAKSVTQPVAGFIREMRKEA